MTHMANDAKVSPDLEGGPANGRKATPLSLRLSLGIWLVGSFTGWAVIYYLAVQVWGR